MKMAVFHGQSLNNKGQFAIEAVLLMTILVGAFMFVTKEARDRKLIQNMAAGSIDRIANMSGYGTWKAECKGIGRSNRETLGKCHPNSISRALSSKPDPL